MKLKITGEILEISEIVFLTLFSFDKKIEKMTQNTSKIGIKYNRKGF